MRFIPWNFHQCKRDEQGHSKSTYALKGGVVTQKSVQKYKREEGEALQRMYVRSCNFQIVITCEAS